MMDPQANARYTLQDGQYVFMAYGRQCGAALPSVAILFDQRHQRIIKHGASAFVQREQRIAELLYLAEGLASDDLVLIDGRFDLDELNRAISQYDYIGVLHAKLLAEQELQAREVALALFARLTSGTSASLLPGP
jgi:hypothetical protein